MTSGKAILEWKDQYSLGNPALDHEHKELIRMINEVHEEIERVDGADDGAHVIEGLTEILGAVAAHFALEEKEMQSSSYSGMSAHKADHEKLLDEIYDLVELVEDTGVRDIREELSAVLEAWFGVHFQTFDREYHTSVRSSD